MFNPSKKFIGVETLKAYNPSTAHRRKERDAEKKKNKAERKITREQALLKKNPVVIKEELDKLEEMGEQAYVAAVALLPQVQLLQLMAMQPTLTLSLSGQTMTEGRTRRLQKLQQLWAQVVSSVEAERRVRTADVSSVASVDPRSSSSSSTVNARCLQQRLSNGERVPDEDERRYYCPELCNTGIFRHPDGSVRPYPPPVANDKSEQRRRFVETQQRRMRERRGPSRHSDMSSDSESEDESTAAATNSSSSSSSSKKIPGADTAPAGAAAEDFLASIPLPAEPPPAPSSSQVPTVTGQQPAMPAPPSIPMVPPLPFPVPPLGAYSGASPPPGGPHQVVSGFLSVESGNSGPLRGLMVDWLRCVVLSASPPKMQGPHGPPAFFPPGFVPYVGRPVLLCAFPQPPFMGIPAPPSQLVAHMQQMQQQQQQPEQQRVPPHTQQGPPPSQPSPGAAGLTNVQKRPPQQRTPPTPAKKQHTDNKLADASDLKAAMAFVPTHLRTKKLPATAKTQEGPSISRVSAYSMGTAALGRQGGSGGASGQISGLAKFLGDSKKQQGEGGGIGGAAKAPAPADLDRAFDEFLKEVGAS
ncbi:hypothetical protein, conserved [Eimeria acervulina]|uniref:Wbp11/ELF5/Saf1 N-terminal domain-containing protein n=1 Tax=Eimeria acervulina TaxID=5801 RepID=U6GA38_EIMAC|nr:hypothetical protein, conserved [Eimeria acervulina]CDI76198.1 hypothetical protein, conserved [Eimeria acervulina]